VECLSLDRRRVADMVALIKRHNLPITYTPRGSTKRMHRRVVYLEGLLPQSQGYKVMTVKEEEKNYPFETYSPSLGNTLEAYVLRTYLVEKPGGQYGQPPLPDPYMFDNLDNMTTELADLLRDHVLLDRPEYVKQTPPSRRKAYEAALDVLQRQGYQSRFDNVKGFVKFQKEEGKIPRPIDPPYEERIIEEGRYVKSMEESEGAEFTLFSAIDEMWHRRGVMHKVCFKGVTMSEFGEILYRKQSEFADPVFVSMDCSRFSQHTGRDALNYFAKFVDKIFPGAFDVLRAKRRHASVTASEDGVQYAVKCKLPYKLCDGTPSTSATAFVVINMIMMECLKGLRVEPYDNGDDFGLVCDQSDYDEITLLVPELLKYGYKLKVEQVVYDISQLSFCRMTPIQLSVGWRMIRPVSSLEKDAILFCTMGEVSDRMFAVGMGGAHLNYGVPVYHAFYRAMVRLSGLTSMKQKHMMYLRSHNYSYYRAMLETGYDVNNVVEHSDLDRARFYMTTGIEPVCQVVLEKMYDAMVLGDRPSIWHKLW